MLSGIAGLEWKWVKMHVNTLGYYSQAPRKQLLGMPFVQNWLRKTPYALCRSCRGIRDLQLSYYPHGPLQLEKFEKNSLKVGQSEQFLS
jgi:hypothetical protein